MSRFVVSIRDITDRNTLASILYADPVCIRKINANSRPLPVSYGNEGQWENDPQTTGRFD